MLGGTAAGSVPNLRSRDEDRSSHGGEWPLCLPVAHHAGWVQVLYAAAGKGGPSQPPRRFIRGFTGDCGSLSAVSVQAQAVVKLMDGSLCSV